ncbi:MAG: hypothetical protein ACXW3D_01295 [Caulobacteraceae bacterium]
MDLKFWGMIGGALALVAAIFYVSHLRADHSRLARRDKAHLACVAAVKGDKKAEQPADVCDPAIAGAVLARDQSIACETALLAKPRNNYAVANICPSGVKTLHAEAGVLARERDAARGDLVRERADQQDAIKRAEARVTLSAERKAHADAAQRAAPRDGDGLIVYDARGLRDRYQAAAQARPRP